LRVSFSPSLSLPSSPPPPSPPSPCPPCRAHSPH
jgi:hypothetical protein